MNEFYKYRTERLLPICILSASIITFIFITVSFYHYIKNASINIEIILFILSIIVLLWLFILPLGIKADKEGIYLNNEFVIWKRLLKSQICAIKDIKAIVILHNITQKGAIGTTVPVYETTKTDNGTEYVYSIVLISDLTHVNFNYSSNDLFIRDYKDIVIGCAIYNQILVEELLKRNTQIKIIEGRLKKNHLGCV